MNPNLTPRSEFRHGARVEKAALTPIPSHPIANLVQVFVWMCMGLLAIYLGLCEADRQYEIIAQVNQESVHHDAR